MALASPPITDAAQARALTLLEHVALIDGHNDMPYVRGLTPRPRAMSPPMVSAGSMPKPIPTFRA